MHVHLTASFEIESWDETPFDGQSSVPKLTQAAVTKAYSGDIEGTSKTVWLMAYAGDGSATFVGLERLTGKIGDRDGTLVLQHTGSYVDGAAKANLAVIAGANSGGLASATGDGDLLANPAGSVTLKLELE